MGIKVANKKVVGRGEILIAMSSVTSSTEGGVEKS